MLFIQNSAKNNTIFGTILQANEKNLISNGWM
jgi:hypothetical protein